MSAFGAFSSLLGRASGAPPFPCSSGLEGPGACGLSCWSSGFGTAESGTLCVSGASNPSAPLCPKPPKPGWLADV